MPQAGLEEIDRALWRFRDSPRPLETMRREDFEIPTLVPLLRDVAKELENGRGFVQVKGLAAASPITCPWCQQFCTWPIDNGESRMTRNEYWTAPRDDEGAALLHR